MPQEQHQGGVVVVITLILSLILTMLPLPEWAELFRPEWSLLVLIYWTLALPERVGVFSGWTMGILVDTIHGTLLGQYALGFAFAAFFTHYGHLRMRIYHRWQQAVVVLVLALLVLLIRLWVDGLSGYAVTVWYYWIPALTTMLCWAPIFALLRMVRRYYGVQ